MDLRYLSLMAAANVRLKVSEYTHHYYRYPARFGESFVREAILNFSRPNSTVLDPFCGGGTAVVEALAQGRRAIGNDLSSLAIKVAKAKTTPLSTKQLNRLQEWVMETGSSTYALLREDCNPHDHRLTNLPPWHRRLVASMVKRVDQLPRGDCQTFARCLLLKTMQWAFDGKELLPDPSEIVARLPAAFDEMRRGMTSYTSALQEQGLLKRDLSASRSLLNGSAAEIDTKVVSGSVSLVVTSPPYLGVHVLYNRWQLKGRRELKVPFYIADCEDLGGASKYTIIARGSKEHQSYFDAVSKSFAAIRRTLARDAYVVQLVSFARSSSLPHYLDAMKAAGLDLCETYMHTAGDFGWRSVPGRRWYARVGAIENSTACQEVLLVHRGSR
jgi:DNA modification methylase